MKIKILLVFLVLVSFSFAQPYRHSLGLKSGYPGVINLNHKFFLPTAHHRLSLESSVGVNFDLDNQYLNVQPMLGFNQPIGISTGYLIYLGLAPTAQYYVKGAQLQEDGSKGTEKFVFRTDALFGVEFSGKEHRIPLTIAFDLGPSYVLIPEPKFFFAFNIALRYIVKAS